MKRVGEKNKNMNVNMNKTWEGAARGIGVRRVGLVGWWTEGVGVWNVAAAVGRCSGRLGGPFLGGVGPLVRRCWRSA